MSDREEQEKPARPRVVDKRVSARRASTEDTPRPEPAPQASPGGGGGRPTGSTEGSGPIPVPPASGGSGVPDPASVPVGEPGGPPAGGTSGAPPEEALWTPEQEAEAQRVAQEIADTPSRDLLLNIAGNLINLAAIKVDMGDPLDARLLIDALAAISRELGPSLGSAEAPLRQTVAQLQVAYAEKVGGQASPPRPAT
jgi:hypothetical protein